jgi:hypothetical protein
MQFPILNFSLRGIIFCMRYDIKTIKKFFGSTNPGKRLSLSDIAKIIYYYRRCGYTQKRLAKMFGVSRDRIYRIRKFTTWRNLLDKKDEKYPTQMVGLKGNSDLVI